MPVSISAEIPMPVSALWDIIGDFAGLRRWHPLIVSCTAAGDGVGAVRTVHFADWWAEETLVALDPARHGLRYRVTASSRPAVVGVEAEMDLTDLGSDQTRLDWRSGHDEGHPDAGPVNESLAAYYPVRIGHLRAALGLAI